MSYKNVPGFRLVQTGLQKIFYEKEILEGEEKVIASHLATKIMTNLIKQNYEGKEAVALLGINTFPENLPILVVILLRGIHQSQSSSGKVMLSTIEVKNEDLLQAEFNLMKEDLKKKQICEFIKKATNEFISINTSGKIEKEGFFSFYVECYFNKEFPF
jgi:isochorismate synthase EntC